MMNSELADFYERDIRKLIVEINLFKNEENLWHTSGTIKNSCGNLALHIICGLNYLIGEVLSHSGYVRNRNLEFTAKGVDRKLIVEQLEKLIDTIRTAISQFTAEQMESPFPIFFDKENATNGYVLTQLLLHLNYHLGQVNYLRRMLE
jgi:hypothetical protein